MTATAASVLADANDRFETCWELHGRLSGGYQSGAYLVVAPDGRRAVLKWSSARDWAPTVLAAAPVVEAARAAGWPTPAWLVAGQTAEGYPYQLQEFVDGSTQADVTHDWLDLVLPVVAGHAGMATPRMRDWSAYDRDVVFAAENRNRGAVLASGPAGARVVDVITRVNRDHRHVTLPALDLVHGDLNPENVLIADGPSVALVDVEAVGRGSRLHDLTTLLLYATLWGEREVHDRLTAECRRIAEPGWIEISLSAVAIDLLAFGVEHWPADDLADLCAVAAGLIDHLGT